MPLTPDEMRFAGELAGTTEDGYGEEQLWNVLADLAESHEALLKTMSRIDDVCCSLKLEIKHGNDHKMEIAMGEIDALRKGMSPPKEKTAVTIPGQPSFGFVNLLGRAKKHLSDADAFRIYPLRNTHINDVPVNMALFAGEQIRAAVQADRKRCADLPCPPARSLYVTGEDKGDLTLGETDAYYQGVTDYKAAIREGKNE